MASLKVEICLKKKPPEHKYSVIFVTKVGEIEIVIFDFLRNANRSRAVQNRSVFSEKCKAYNVRHMNVAGYFFD